MYVKKLVRGPTIKRGLHSSIHHYKKNNNKQSNKIKWDKGFIEFFILVTSWTVDNCLLQIFHVLKINPNSSYVSSYVSD